MSIVNNGVATAKHHLSKLECLLSIGTGTVIFSRDRVRNSEDVKTQLLFRRGFDMRRIKSLHCSNFHIWSYILSNFYNFILLTPPFRSLS